MHIVRRMNWWAMILGIGDRDRSAMHSFQFCHMLIMIMMMLTMITSRQWHLIFVIPSHIDFEAQKFNTKSAWVKLAGHFILCTAMTLYQCGPHTQFDNIWVLHYSVHESIWWGTLMSTAVVWHFISVARTPNLTTLLLARPVRHATLSSHHWHNFCVKNI